MAPQSSQDRICDLVMCAIRVFIAQGYRRTQMADIAKAMGVAKGTVYLYVESKDTLFHLAVQASDRPSRLDELTEFPVPAPVPGATLTYIQERLAQEPPVASLAAALQQPGVLPPQVEIPAIIRDLYAKLNCNRTFIKLIDRCAPDYPELAALWYQAGRGDLLQDLAQYLELQRLQGHLFPCPDVAIVARLLIETVTFWAVHRHWDPAPQTVDDAVVEGCVVQFLTHALIQEAVL